MFFICIKLILFSYILSFFFLFDTFEIIIGIKPAPGDNKSNFKKVGSIPCGFNTMGTNKPVLLRLKRVFVCDAIFSDEVNLKY